MRAVAVVVATGLLGIAVGLFGGSALCHTQSAARAHAALERASAALSVGRRDEALEYAFAAIERDPELYAAYELAGDALGTAPPGELRRHFYRAALGHADQRARARIQAKIASLVD